MAINVESMKINIYHGSDHIIEKPLFGEGKPYNDYGRGFYCTEHAELAKEWACSADSDGYANHYQLDLNGLSVLNLNAPEYNILNWLAILLENRKFNVADGLPQRAKAYLMENFKVDYKKYDVIIGYRAKYRQIAIKPVAEDETYVLDIIRNNLKNGQGI